MCWSHVVWCCFHGEKCKKQNKTQHLEKSFMSYLHNRLTLEHDLNRFQRLLCRAMTFNFWPFLVMVMWPIILTPHWMDPDRHHLVFLYFLVKPGEIPFLGHMQRTLTWTLKAVHNDIYIICTIPIFCNIFWVFLVFFHYNHLNFLFWTPTLDPETAPHNTDHHSYFFLIFSLFYGYVSSRNANLSIFGNAHWTLKQHSHHCHKQ